MRNVLLRSRSDLMRAMKLQFDVDLIEACYLASEIPDDPERDRIYQITDAQERDEAFIRHHVDWFRRTGLEKAVWDALAEWPLIAPVCSEIVVRQVRRSGDEFAELFRLPESPARIGLGLRASRTISPGLRNFLRHEFCHIQDMLDPAYGYPLELSADSSAHGEILRERYRLLWDLRIDNRLARRFPDEPDFPADITRHVAAFTSLFAFLSDVELTEWMTLLSSDHPPSHEILFTWASDPRRHQGVTESGLPGAPCPVCSFTTFDWACPELVRTAAPVISSSFPAWEEKEGCCARCVEVYAAVASARPPSTVLLRRAVA